jgi:hypothetical protein
VFSRPPSVSVVGDFNFWDGRRHAMCSNGFGDLHPRRGGDKKAMRSPGTRALPLKSDPSVSRRRLLTARRG